MTQFLFHPFIYLLLYYYYIYILAGASFFFSRHELSYFYFRTGSNPTPRASWSRTGHHVGPVPRAENPEAPPRQAPGRGTGAPTPGLPRARPVPDTCRPAGLPAHRLRVEPSSCRRALHPLTCGSTCLCGPDVSGSRGHPPEWSGTGLVPYHVGEATGGTGKRGGAPPRATRPIRSPRGGPTAYGRHAHHSFSFSNFDYLYILIILAAAQLVI